MSTEKTIYVVANDLLSKHGGNFDKAKEALKTLFLTDPRIVDEYRNEIFERAAYAIVQCVSANKRSVLFNAVPTLEKGTSGETQQRNVTKRVEATIRNDTNILLNMFLNKCKKRLTAATKDDLAEEINMFTQHARGNDFRRAFLTDIFKELGDTETVGERYTENDLNQIMEHTQSTVNKKWKDKFVKCAAPAEV